MISNRCMGGFPVKHNVICNDDSLKCTGLTLEGTPCRLYENTPLYHIYGNDITQNTILHEKIKTYELTIDTYNRTLLDYKSKLSILLSKHDKLCTQFDELMNLNHDLAKQLKRAQFITNILFSTLLFEIFVLLTYFVIISFSKVFKDQ